jgi:calcineurin-like phosphoesterase family protein
MINYFTSDLHLGHANIIKYCGRTLFMNKEELSEYNRLLNATQEEQRKMKISEETLVKMNKVLINNINSRVKEDDILYHVGDFCFKKSKEAPEGKVFDYFRNQINCKTVYFIAGNHDANNSTKTIIQNMTIAISNKRINLVHNPEHININYEINLVGHVHQNWQIQRIRQGYSFIDAINVGCDVWKFMPITINEILGRYNQWKKLNNLP